MAHSNGRIYIDSNSTGVEIADLQRVLGRGTGDLGLLCGDMEWDRTQTPAVLARANKTNPMAKYKPVRHNALRVLTASQRASVRYGFSTPIPWFTLTGTTVPASDWEYLPPRGKGQGASGADEWFRLRDFEGYDHNAGCPLVPFVGQLAYDEKSSIILFGDAYSNAIRTDGKVWSADQSLSFSELLASNSDYSGHYIAFALIDTTDGGRNLVVTDTTVQGFVNEYSHMTFELWADGSGTAYPSIPILDDARKDHEFVVIVCLSAGNNPSSGVKYSVITQDFPTVYSLGFVSGCDRATAKLATGQFTMDGTTFEVTMDYVDTAIEQQFNGYTWRAYMVVVRAVFDTSNVNYYGREIGVSGDVVLDASLAMGFGPSPSSMVSQLTRDAAASLVGGTAGQNKPIFTSDSSTYLWLMKNNGAVIPQQVTATLTIDEPMRTPYSDDATITIPSNS